MSKPMVRQVDFSSSVSDDEHIFTIANKFVNSPKITTYIMNCPIEFVIDTGASVNIIDHSSYKAFVNKPKLQSPVPKLYAFGSKNPLSVQGFFESEIRYKSNITQAKFYVLELNTSNNLLSGETAQRMHFIQFSLQTGPKSIPDEFPALFDGSIGRIKNIKIKLLIDKSVPHVSQRHQRIPFHVRKDVDKELDRLEKMDVIEKVDGPTPWISPIVVVPKKNGGVRICVDMREPNKAIRSERHPMTMFDDFISDLNGTIVFSKPDLTNAYHQRELDEASRYITTFTTHVGLRSYKCLLFAAAEIFQNAIAEVLNNIPGARNLSDDIIVQARHSLNMMQAPEQH